MPSWMKVENDDILLNSEMAALHFGVTPRTLNFWQKKGCPKATRGWWNIREVMQWNGQNTSSDSLAARKLKAEVEYREAKATQENKKVEIQEGFYFAKEDVIQEWSKRILEIKSGLLALKRKIAGEIVDPDMRNFVEGLVEVEVYDLLQQYSRNGQYTPKS